MADTPKALAPIRTFGRLSKDAQTLMDARMAAHKPHSGDTALPLKLPRANLSNEFIMGEAERIARQMSGEHVTSGKAGDTKNLSGKSMKEAARVKTIPYTIRPTGTIAPERTYVPQKGEVRVAVPGDQTLSNSILESLHGEPNEAVIEGGAKYGLGAQHLPVKEFWKSGPRPATSLQNKVDRLYDLYEPESVVGSHLAMGSKSNDFAMHLADASLRAIDYSTLSPKNAQIFDSIIAKGYFDPVKGKQVSFPDWAGIADPETALAQMEVNPELRKWVNNRFKTPQITEPLGLPNGLDVQYAITEPALRDMEINVTGLSSGRMVRGAPVVPEGKPHRTYTDRIEGESIGPTENLEPFVMAFPDAADYVAKTKRPADFTGTIQKVFPHQVVDDQYLNQLGEYHNRLNQLIKGGGKKDGGKVDAKKDGASNVEAVFRKKIQEMLANHHRVTAKADGGGVHMAGGGGKNAMLNAMKRLKSEADAAFKSRKLVDPSKVDAMRYTLPPEEAAANKAAFLAKSKDPERYYHGTKKEITEFKPKTADTVFLTREPKFADQFALDHEGTGPGLTDVHLSGAHVMPLRAQVENPFDPDLRLHIQALEDKINQLYPRETAGFGLKGEKLSDEDLAAQMLRTRDMPAAYHSLSMLKAPFNSSHNWFYVEHPTIQDAIRQMGHDAYYATENGTKNLGVYNPKKIKSDIGNIGTYDTNDADITKKDGGWIYG